MIEPKETAYGQVYLSDERYEEFIKIVGKHTTALMTELLEHKIAPTFLSLEKTSIYELDDLKELDRQRQLNRKES